MTKKEMVDMYVRSRSIDGKDYPGDKVEPIMPFIIGDLCYQTYLNATNGLELKHDMKRMDVLWRKAYEHFNKPFFSTYPEESHWEVTDLMDSLTDALSNDITILRSRIMLIIDDVEFSDKMRITNFLLANILAQYAQKAWGCIYKVQVVTGVGGGFKKEHVNQDLQKMRDWSFKIAVTYFKSLSRGFVRLSEVNVDSIFDVISKHIYDWIEEN